MDRPHREPPVDLDLATEVYRLEAALADVLDALPAKLRTAAAEIPARIDPDFGSSPRWVDRFSRVTLLYPLLHSEGVLALDRDAARHCCVAQTLFVVHAFIDDHQLDGQLVLSREERLLDRWLVATALETLRRSLPELGAALDVMASLQQAYVEAQTWPYATPPPGFEPAAKWPAAASAGRAALGLIPTLALALASGCTEAQLRQIKGAFDELAFGLQWMDDLEDWKDDRRGGRENLLLHELTMQTSDVEAQAPATEDDVAVELMRHGIIARAVSEAKQAFHNAQATAADLGCRTLRDLIQRKIARVEAIETSLAKARIAMIFDSLRANLGQEP